jgi:hypothetical protein
MVMDIRMAGFGNLSMVLPGVTIGGKTFNNVLNLDNPVAGSLTLLAAIGGSVTLTASGIFSNNQITVSSLTDGLGNPLFDTGDRKYISIGGLESHIISSIDSGTKTLTLSGTLVFDHPVDTPVFGIRAISYQVGVVNGISTLIRDENMGGGSQPQSDNIENLQFEYFDTNGIPTATPADIRIIRVTLTARTNMSDPEMKVGDGYRRRQVASNIHLRNMGIIP